MSTVLNSRGILHPWWWRHHVLSHRHKTLTRRHNVISQKTRYAIVFVAQTSYLVDIISPFSWHWKSHVTDQHTALYSRSLGSNLVLETDYWTGVPSSFYLYPRTVAALKRFRTQQNPDLLTILHSDGIHSGQLTDYCEYHHFARITHVSFCRCTSPCFMPRIFSPETKSNSQHSKFYLQFLEVFRGSLTHVFTTRLYLTNESHKPVLRLFLVALVCCPKNDVRKLGVHLLQIRANWKLHSSLLRDLSSSSIYWSIILLKKIILYRSRGSSDLNVSLKVKEGRDWRHKDTCATVSLINHIKFSHWLRQRICCQKLPYSSFITVQKFLAHYF